MTQSVRRYDKLGKPRDINPENIREVSLSVHNHSVDLTTGSLWDNIWHMTWPMLLVMFFNFLVGLTDIYVAGFIGPEIQAIVGLWVNCTFS